MPGDGSSFDPRESLRQLAEQRAEEKLADNWRAHYECLDRPRRAWADLLLREPWHWFCTLTFRPRHEGRGGGVHPEAAGKAFGLLVGSINESMYGKRWRETRRAQGGVVWANGTEFHKDGRIHFHALLSCPQIDLNLVERRLTWMDWWRTDKHGHERFGFARIEPPESQDDVAGYVSKYVVKGGEVDFSANFGAVRPPPLVDQPFALRPRFSAPGAQIFAANGPLARQLENKR